jgi:hypothetical protein
MLGLKNKFSSGTILMTCGVNSLVAESEDFAKFVSASLGRHLSGDWGELCAEDRQENEFALLHNLRLFSAYKADNLPKIWIITEADRSATTVLFPGEY